MRIAHFNTFSDTTIDDKYQKIPGILGVETQNFVSLPNQFISNATDIDYPDVGIDVGVVMKVSG
jgi:hypothetical protein